jgi:hypothetical protein
MTDKTINIRKSFRLVESKISVAKYKSVLKIRYISENQRSILILFVELYDIICFPLLFFQVKIYCYRSSIFLILF